jgi:DNA polymerase-3 subunit epsilon
MREIVLDTETTGLDPRTGHRLIEIACVELEDFLPTGRTFHRYVHPDRPIDPDAQRVHGISLEFLTGMPRFHEAEVCDAFLDFVGDARLVAHNASFDRGFVDAELERANRQGLGEARWIDTLALAQKRFPGMYNSLDALCKRYKISLAEREKHGALIDAQLLAAVYLELRGGKERRLDLTPQAAPVSAAATAARTAYAPRTRPLAPRSTDDERAAHAEFVRRALKDKAVWLMMELEA